MKLDCAGLAVRLSSSVLFLIFLKIKTWSGKITERPTYFTAVISKTLNFL